MSGFGPACQGGPRGEIRRVGNVWKASGHIEKFIDPILITENNLRYRADHFLEEQLNMTTDGLSNSDILELIKTHKLTYSGETIIKVENMNLMFSSIVGTPIDAKEKDDSIVSSISKTFKILEPLKTTLNKKVSEIINRCYTDALNAKNQRRKK